MYQAVERLNASFHSAGFTLGAEAADVRTINVVLRDIYGAPLAKRFSGYAYLANDVAGDTYEAASATLSSAAGTNGVISELATDNSFYFTSESNGTLDIAITETAANTVYLCLVNVLGEVVASAAIAFV